jgi:hypothetical protein
MRQAFKLWAISALLACAVCSHAAAQSVKYKCLLQMSNYIGNGAYIAVSLIDPQGAYERTLYVMGDDKQWYKTLKEWNAFQSKRPTDISAITRASVAGGDRSVTTMEFDDAKIDKGYKLRFETAVEDQKYHATDVEIPLSAEALSKKTEGTGYIRYVKFSKVE